MTARVFNEREKLAEIESMIISLKSARMYGTQLDILRAIASDLRGRLPHTSTKALETLDKKVAYCVEHKTPLGYDQGSLAHLGGYVIGFWPTIRAALAEHAQRNSASGENHEDDSLRETTAQTLTK